MLQTGNNDHAQQDPASAPNAEPDADTVAHADDDLQSRLAGLVAQTEALQARTRAWQERAAALRERAPGTADRRRLDARFHALPAPKALRDPGPGRDLAKEPGVPEQVLNAYQAETGIAPERIRELMQGGESSDPAP